MHGKIQDISSKVHTHTEQQWNTYNNCLEDLGGDGGENPLIKVNPNVGVDVRQGLLLWTEQNTKSDVNILQVCKIYNICLANFLIRSQS